MDGPVASREIAAGCVGAAKNAVAEPVARFVLLGLTAIGRPIEVVVLARKQRLVIPIIHSVGVVVPIHAFLAKHDDMRRALLNLSRSHLRPDKTDAGLKV